MTCGSKGRRVSLFGYSLLFTVLAGWCDLRVEEAGAVLVWVLFIVYGLGGVCVCDLRVEEADAVLRRIGRNRRVSPRE